MQPRILTDTRLVQTDSSLRATSNVTVIGELGEIGFKTRVIHTENRPPWVGFPQEKFQSNGKDKFVDVVSLSQGLKRLIAEQVLSEYERLVQ